MDMLRIVSILLIVTFHCAYKSGFVFGDGLSVNKFVVKLFWMFGELGVNLFILITGYFQIARDFRWKKLLGLACEVYVYHWVTILFGCYIGAYRFTGKKSVFLAFFPVTLNWYWYVTAYMLVYILSPYLNRFARGMDQPLYRRFLLTMMVIFSAIPTVFGLLYNTTEGMLYYNRLIWLSIMYCAGGYLRLYGSPLTRSLQSSALLSAGAFLVLAVSIVLIDVFGSFFAALGTTEQAYLWPPNTVPMVLLSVGVFGIFLNLKMKPHPIVNRIGRATMGIYLLHDGVLSTWLWMQVFCCAHYQDSLTLLPRMLFAVAVIFTVGTVIDISRQWAASALGRVRRRTDC